MRAGQLFQAGFLKEQVDHVRGQLGTGLRLAVEALQQVLGSLGADRVANQLELVAAIADLDVQAFFDLVQVLVELPAEVGEAAGVEGIQGEAVKFQGGVQGVV
ncbi:hypothetical protein D3C78_1216540 [compost metagenome]